ncbi:MAG: carbonic anhydrase [Planctomycetes bacterium]|nr:carbonic anhydrase [Planctomycetota bacterium]NUQ34233.1 carbonic anhydrase [Planctomycetaceae bacterium]
MKKLIRGIIDFRKHRIGEYREKFSKLALGQAPDTLFIACSDSRVVPNLFASTDPGDLFVIRNVANLIPPCDTHGQSKGDLSEWAAIEFAVLQLRVSDIVVCGHSECGGINAILNGRDKAPGDHLRCWLEHGEHAASVMARIDFSGSTLAEHNKISQANVLLQLDHLRSYPVIQDRIKAGNLAIHGWWFDIGSGDVHAYNEKTRRFALIGA